MVLIDLKRVREQNHCGGRLDFEAARLMSAPCAVNRRIANFSEFARSLSDIVWSLSVSQREEAYEQKRRPTQVKLVGVSRSFPASFYAYTHMLASSSVFPYVFPCI